MGSRPEEPSAVEGFEPLAKSFYDAPVLTLAKNLVGTLLVHRSPEGVMAGRIVETEAYRGPEDLAAHSARGRRTKRTEVMFGPAGRAYVFLLYGASWAFNVVAGAEGEPHAVLVRSVEPIFGVDLMSSRRGMAQAQRELTNGPGKLCKALAIDRSHYGEDLGGERLFLANGWNAARVGRSARINIDYAEVWAERPWRFFERGNRYVSVKPRD